METRLSWRTRVRRSPTTFTIALVCFASFAATVGVCWHHGGTFGLRSLWSLADCGDALVALGGLRLSRVWDEGEWWRVVTAAGLHGSVLHLVFNVASLRVVGEWAEWTWGSWRAGWLFVISAVGGSLASLAWAEAPMVIGASGGVLGIAGGLLAAKMAGGPETKRRLAPLRGGALAMSLGVLLILGTVVPVIAQAGHVGGLVTGFLLGLAWSVSRGGWAWAWRASCALAVSALAVFALYPVRPAARAEMLGFSRLEEGRAAEAIPALEVALRARADDPDLANAVAYAMAEANVDLGRAEVLVTRALRADPRNADYLDTWGWVLCRQGRYAGGERVLRRARALATGPTPEIDEHLRGCRGAHTPLPGTG